MAYIPEITDQDIAKVKYALRGAVGESNRIDAVTLTEMVYGKYSDTLRRSVRAIVQHINTDQADLTIISTDTSEGGFWLADVDPLPIARMYNSEHGRGTAILAKASSIEAKGKRKFGKDKWAKALQEVKKQEPKQAGFGF